MTTPKDEMKTSKLLFPFSLLFVALMISCQETSRSQKASYNNETESFDANFAVAQGNALWQRKNREAEQTVTLNVLFLNGSRERQDKVKAIAPEWGKYGNIDFIFSTDKESKKKFDIVINITEKGGGGDSYVGNQSKYFSSKLKPSMNLHSVSKMVVLHEFGHALGLQHEHQHPERAFEYDQEGISEFCSKDPKNKESCERNWLKTHKGRNTILFQYDVDSVMHYQIHHSLLANSDESIYATNTLSTLDKVAIATLYPGRATEDEIRAKGLEQEQLVLHLFDLGEVRNCSIKTQQYEGKDAYYYKRRDLAPGEKNTISHYFFRKNNLVDAMISDENCDELSSEVKTQIFEEEKRLLELFDLGEVKNCSITTRDYQGRDGYFYRKKELAPGEKLKLSHYYFTKTGIVEAILKDQGCEELNPEIKTQILEEEKNLLELFDLGQVKECSITTHDYKGRGAYFYRKKELAPGEELKLSHYYFSRTEIVEAILKDENCEGVNLEAKNKVLDGNTALLNLFDLGQVQGCRIITHDYKGEDAYFYTKKGLDGEEVEALSYYFYSKTEIVKAMLNDSKCNLKSEFN